MNANANPNRTLEASHSTQTYQSATELDETDTSLLHLLSHELRAEVKSSAGVQAVVERIATEVERICRKSDRIQTSGQIKSWQVTLARHRLRKCLTYYQLGAKQGRVELHSHLGAIVYRHVASARCQLGFQGRYGLIDDFLQGFYIEAIKAFRRENQMAADYSPRTQLELAEYMAFTEQYAKRRINLRSGSNQQLIVLRAQEFARRQPPETTVDIEKAAESPKKEESESYVRDSALQQVRAQIVAAASAHSAETSSERDRVVAELVQYLEDQGQSDCVDYLSLKLQDLPAAEIDAILGLSRRQRDYLQQRFKYHLEKFAHTHHWQLVHQWLGADLDQKLGMSSQQWEAFLRQLSPQQQQMLQLKKSQATDQAIALALKCTPKQLQKRWTQLLSMASAIRNGNAEVQVG